MLMTQSQALAHAEAPLRMCDTEGMRRIPLLSEFSWTIGLF